MAGHSARFHDLQDKAVLITGGGSGIGAALVRGFTEQGSSVTFLDIVEGPSQALCDGVEKESGRRPLFIRCDLRDIAALRAAIVKAEDAHGATTVLVNNAALDDRHDIADVTPDYWDDNQAINLRPHFFAAQAVAPGMRNAGGGSIINFTSTSFLINHPDMPSYVTAKAAIIGLTKGLAGKLGRDHIRVNAIAPGWVMTQRQKDLWANEEALGAHVAGQALPDVMQPDDMVGPVLFLASDASRLLTAQTMIVDGGYL